MGSNTGRYRTAASPQVGDFSTGARPFRPDAAQLPLLLIAAATLGYVAAIVSIYSFPHEIASLIERLNLMKARQVAANPLKLALGVGTMYAAAVVLLGVEAFLNRRGRSAILFLPREHAPGGSRAFSRACLAASIICAASIPVFGLRYALGVHWLFVEDGPMEYATFLGYAVAAALTALCISSAQRSQAPRLINAGLWGMLLLCLFIAFEEISWGQRLAGVETPNALSEINTQGELNLHNIFTDQFTAFYWIAGLVLLISCSAAVVLHHLRPELRILRYAPHAFLLPIIAMIAAVSFHINLDELVEPLSAAVAVLYAAQLQMLVRSSPPGPASAP